MAPTRPGSEHSVTVVEISVDPLEAADRADEVARWLTGSGVITPDPTGGRDWRSSAYRAGDRVRDAAPGWPGGLPDGPGRGVDILVERALYRCAEEWSRPRCPECGADLDEEVQEDLIRPWLDGTEPAVTCRRCDRTHPLGDWPGAYQVGELAVRFNNWPALADSFVARLGERLGTRWRVVHEHF
jgi:hypothetical protein